MTISLEVTVSQRSRMMQGTLYRSSRVKAALWKNLEREGNTESRKHDKSISEDSLETSIEIVRRAKLLTVTGALR